MDDFKQREDISIQSSTPQSSSPSAILDRLPTQLESGQILEERYKVLSLIGRGGVGCVYKVEQILLQKEFALKTIDPVASDITVRRFQKEAQTVSRLDHPNLVRAFDFGLLNNNQPFLVMELVQGPTLAQYLKKKGRLSKETVLQIFIPICSALDYAHQQGVTHRDIKPSNIVLVPTESSDQFIPKIVDFGIAKIELADTTDGQALTKTGEVFGTPLYMSPEQCSGAKVDSRSDIYSLGCVIFEALTGAPPFRGQTALETMMQHTTSTPLSMREASLGLEFDHGLEGVVSKMLEKNPNERYQRCSDVAQDLELLQSGKTRNQNASGNKTTSALSPSSSINLKWRLTAAIVCAVVAVIATALLFSNLLFSKQDVYIAAHTPTAAAVRSKQNAESGDEQILDDALDPNKIIEQNIKLGYKDVGVPGNATSQITDSALKGLLQRNDVEKISLNGQRLLDDECVRYFEKQPLLSLNITGTQITDKGLHKIAKIRTLEKLDLRYTHTNTALKELRVIPHLRELHVSRVNVGDDGLMQIAQIKTLEDLWVQGNSKPDSGELGAIKDNRITDPGFLSLRTLSGLATLCVEQTNITDRGLQGLKKLKNLVNLFLAGSEDITDAGMESISSLPALEVLDLSNTHITNVGLSKLHGMKTLTTVKLFNCTGVTASGIKQLEHTTHCTVQSERTDNNRR